jgi:hypothetical protein
VKYHRLFYSKKQRNMQFYKLIFNFDVFYIFLTSRFNPKGDMVGLGEFGLGCVRLGWVRLGWVNLG